MCLAIPGRVETIYEDEGVPMGRVDFGGVIKPICLTLVPELSVGDYAIVHAGFAISRLSESAANETLAAFDQIGGIDHEADESDR